MANECTYGEATRNPLIKTFYSNGFHVHLEDA